MRFQEIISCVQACDTLLEVGCDHAKLTELALRKGVCKRAIASDISALCLEKAKATLCGYNCVEYSVCDGIPANTNADCILICGMGGHTIRDILSRYDGNATLVLSPQSHAELVRGFLNENGYAINLDRCFESAGKFYDVIRAENGERKLSAMQIKYGADYKTHNVALKKRLLRVLENLRGGGEANAERIAEIEEVLAWQK